MPVCSCPLGTGVPESIQEFAGTQLKHQFPPGAGGGELILDQTF